MSKPSIHKTFANENKKLLDVYINLLEKNALSDIGANLMIENPIKGKKIKIFSLKKELSNSYLNKKMFNEDLVNGLIKPNLLNVLNLINYNNHTYDFKYQNETDQYIAHNLLNIGNILFSFNDLLVNLLNDYCLEHKISYYDKSGKDNIIIKHNWELYKDLFEDAEFKHKNLLFHQHEIIFSNKLMSMFNETISQLKVLPVPDRIISSQTINPSIQALKNENEKLLNKLRLNWGFVKAEIKDVQLNNRNSVIEYNFYILFFKKCIFKKVSNSMDNLFEVGNKYNQNSIEKILCFFERQNVIPKFIRQELAFYEFFFRHHVAHGWFSFFYAFLCDYQEHVFLDINKDCDQACENGMVDFKDTRPSQSCLNLRNKIKEESIDKFNLFFYKFNPYILLTSLKEINTSFNINKKQKHKKKELTFCFKVENRESHMQDIIDFQKNNQIFIFNQKKLKKEKNKRKYKKTHGQDRKNVSLNLLVYHIYLFITYYLHNPRCSFNKKMIKF